MTFNALKAKMNGSDETLAEHLGIELPAPAKPSELKVEKVHDTENLMEIVVEFSNTDLVAKSKLEDVNNYRLTSGANIKAIRIADAKVDGNNVILTLDNEGESLVKGRKYDLTIRNIDRAVNKKYTFKAEDDVIPTVEKVEVLGKNGIKVVTSEPIKNPQERNFRVDGERLSMIVEQFGREIILTPYHDRTFPEDMKTLTIEGLEDYAGYRSASYKEEVSLENFENAPKVVAAKNLGNVLEVEFDQDVFHKSVKGYENRRNLGNVSYTERRVDVYTKELSNKEIQDGVKNAYKVAPNKVRYVFERELPRNVKIEISGVANHSDKAMERDTIEPVFTIDQTAPEIINNDSRMSLVTKAETNKGHKAELKLVFDKHLAQDGKNIKAEDHFVIYEREVSRYGEDAAKDVKITNVVVKEDTVTLTLEDAKLNNKNKDHDYILEVRNFTDKSTLGNRMVVDYVDFEIVEAGSEFNIVSPIRTFRVGEYKTEVELVFNSYVDKESASDAKNYFLGGKSLYNLGGEAIVERDGKTVTLVVPTSIKDVEKMDKLEVLPRVTKLNSNSTVKDRFWSLVDGKKIEVKEDERESAITYINKDKANEEIKDANLDVAVDKTTDSKQNIGVTVAGQKDKVLDVLVYKNGKLDSTLSEKVDIADASLTHAIALDKTAKAKYEVTVKVLDGKNVVEEKSLTVNVLDTDVTGTLTYKHSDKVAAVTLDGALTNGKMELPVTSLSSLKTDDFNVATAAKEVNLELAGSNRQLIVTITAEDGTKAVYNIALEVAAGMVPDSDKKEEAITGITETDVNKLLVRFNDGKESIKSISDYKAWMSQTYGVNFKSENLEIKDGKLIIKGELLSSEDWMTVKSKTTTGSYKNPKDIKLDRPYRITVMKSATNNTEDQVFKIAMYGNGSAIVE